MKLYIYNSILNIILIIGIFFKNIFINIASNLDVSLMIILSGISYLILGIILTKFSYKDSKNAIKTSVFTALLFYIFLYLIINLPFWNNSLIESLNSSLIENNYVFYNFIDISLIGILIIYVLTRSIFIASLDLITELANRYTAFGISLFTSYIIEVMFLVPVIYLKEIVTTDILFYDVIRYLTANFIVLIGLSSIMIVIYSLIFIKKKS